MALAATFGIVVFSVDWQFGTLLARFYLPDNRNKLSIFYIIRWKDTQTNKWTKWIRKKHEIVVRTINTNIPALDDLAYTCFQKKEFCNAMC